MNADAQLSVCSCLVPDSSPKDCATHIQCRSSYVNQLNLETPSHTFREVCPLAESTSCQIDIQY